MQWEVQLSSKDHILLVHSLGFYWHFITGLDARNSFAAAVWGVIAVELPLRWNAVTLFYDIGSAVRMIPLMIGATGLLEMALKKEMSQWWMTKPNQIWETRDTDPDAVEQNTSEAMPSSPYQSVDSRPYIWQKSRFPGICSEWIINLLSQVWMRHALLGSTPTLRHTCSAQRCKRKSAWYMR